MQQGLALLISGEFCQVLTGLQAAEETVEVVLRHKIEQKIDSGLIVWI